VSVVELGHSHNNESLDEDEEDDVVDATPNIEQNSTRLSSSYPSTGGEGAATFQVEVGMEDKAKESFFDVLVASTSDSSEFVGFFTPAFILSVLAFTAPGAPLCPATAVFNVAASAAPFGATRVAAFIVATFDAVEALNAATIIGAAEAFDVAIAFAAEATFGAASAFGVVAYFDTTSTFFFPATFIRFLTGRTKASAFFFFVASVLASVPGSGWGP
jgi:hypothetical protein